MLQKKDHEGLKDNYQLNLNTDIHKNNIKLMLKNKIKNNWLIRDQIVRISLVKNVKNRIGENDSN
ncbi:17456_t:CDS:1, partial [Gigaspora rosea]